MLGPLIISSALALTPAQREVAPLLEGQTIDGRLHPPTLTALSDALSLVRRDGPALLQGSVDHLFAPRVWIPGHPLLLSEVGERDDHDQGGPLRHTRHEHVTITVDVETNEALLERIAPVDRVLPWRPLGVTALDVLDVDTPIVALRFTPPELTCYFSQSVDAESIAAAWLELSSVTAARAYEQVWMYEALGDVLPAWESDPRRLTIRLDPEIARKLQKQSDRAARRGEGWPGLPALDGLDSQFGVVEHRLDGDTLSLVFEEMWDMDPVAAAYARLPEVVRAETASQVSTQVSTPMDIEAVPLDRGWRFTFVLEGRSVVFEVEGGEVLRG